MKTLHLKRWKNNKKKHKISKFWGLCHFESVLTNLVLGSCNSTINEKPRMRKWKTLLWVFLFHMHYSKCEHCNISKQAGLPRSYWQIITHAAYTFGCMTVRCQYSELSENHHKLNCEIHLFPNVQTLYCTRIHVGNPLFHQLHIIYSLELYVSEFSNNSCKMLFL